MDRRKSYLMIGVRQIGVRQSVAGVRLLACLALLSSCSSDENATQAAPSCAYGPQCEDGGVEKDVYVVQSSEPPTTTSDAESIVINPLCGGPDPGCNPDDEASCIDTDASEDPDGDGEGGTGAASEGDADASVSACRLQKASSGQQAVCGPAGLGVSADPCLSPADCAPGHTCVGPQGAAATCRQFCCEDSESCKPGTYCAERPVRTDDEGSSPLSAVKAPVCVAPVPCVLDEPYPCTDESRCKCAAGTACMVVRADGTTDCVTPGDGLAGESCPCAAGYVCSQGTNTCLKICKTNAVTEPQCVEGRCQESPQLPEGYGTCVGDEPDAG